MMEMRMMMSLMMMMMMMVVMVMMKDKLYHKIQPKMIQDRLFLYSRNSETTSRK